MLVGLGDRNRWVGLGAGTGKGVGLLEYELTFHFFLRKGVVVSSLAIVVTSISSSA